MSTQAAFIRGDGRLGPARQRGAVIVTACLFLLFLLGFIGFALDFGRLFIVKTELQTAMDSCALAAAQELDAQSTSITRATSAGITAGDLNHVNLQSANWDGKGQLSSTDFTFRDANYAVTTDPVSARYVECAHTQPAVRLWLLQTMGAFFGDAAAFPATHGVFSRAVATRGASQTTCPLPLALRPKTAGAAAPNYGYAPGEWITLLSSPGAGANGYIGWANLDGSNSASETERELREGRCDVRIDAPLGTPGVQASVADAWNARFGIYRNASGPADLYMQPDMTGYAYTSTNWPSASNAYNGTTPPGADTTAANFVSKRASYASCADTGTRMRGAASCSSITGLTINGGFNQLAPPGSGAAGGHWQYGVNRRVALVPVTTTYPGTVQDYACMLLLQPMSIPASDVQLEFIGNAADPGSPCVTNGLPGGAAGPQVPMLVR